MKDIANVNVTLTSHRGNANILFCMAYVKSSFSHDAAHFIRCQINYFELMLLHVTKCDMEIVFRLCYLLTTSRNLI